MGNNCDWSQGISGDISKATLFNAVYVVFPSVCDLTLNPLELQENLSSSMVSAEAAVGEIVKVEIIPLLEEVQKVEVKIISPLNY